MTAFRGGFTNELRELDKRLVDYLYSLDKQPMPGRKIEVLAETLDDQLLHWNLGGLRGFLQSVSEITINPEFVLNRRHKGVSHASLNRTIYI